MDYHPIRPAELFNSQACVLIPRYQRRYSWSIETAHGLIRDVIDAATGSSNLWAGVLIYRTNSPDHPELKCALREKDLNHTCREIIDGQQRLTTIALWINALRHHAEAAGRSIQYSLPNLWLQHPNDKQLEKIINGDDVFDLANDAHPMFQVYTYFRYLLWLGTDSLLRADSVKFPKRNFKGATTEDRWLKHLEKEGEIRSAPVDCQDLLEKTLDRLSFLAINTAGTSPERVFSALNGRRTELSQFDHLRNFVFSELQGPTRDQVFLSSWEPAERALEALPTSSGRSSDVIKSNFLYDYLVSVGEGAHGSFNASKSFSHFHRYRNTSRFKGTIEGWVKEELPDEAALWAFVRHDRLMQELPSGTKLDLPLLARRSIARIQTLSDGPPNPVLQWILRRGFLEKSPDKQLEISEVTDLIRLLESSLVLALLSGTGVTNLRSKFIQGLNALQGTTRHQTGAGTLSKARELIRGPINSVSVKDVCNSLERGHISSPGVNVYNTLKSKGTLSLLDLIEEQLSGGQSRGFLPDRLDSDREDFSVEHILPDKWQKHWRAPLKQWGAAEEELERDGWVQRLGNLTALPGKANTKLSNRSFAEKQSQVGADPSHAAPMLQDWLEHDRWTGNEIRERTQRMCDALLERWTQDFESA